MSYKDILNETEVSVFKNNKLAGTLKRIKNGVSFIYNNSYYNSSSPGISFHITKSKLEHIVSGENLHPFFAGILPEGLRLSSIIKNLKTSSSDLFSILIATGSDVIGDVHVNSKSFQSSIKEDIIKEDFSKIDLQSLFKVSVEKNIIDFKDINSAIPGIQHKISSRMISFPVKIANKNKSYILKLENSEFPNLVRNEFFFMQLAKLCKLDVANVKIIKDINNCNALLVERFDRIYEKEKKEFFKCHQEDSCQFLNVYPQDKYRLNFREIANGLEEFTTTPILEIHKLLKQLVFSYVICNGDLHAKNISIIQGKDVSDVRLSKAYDILSTLPYGDDTMALNFEGKDKNLSRKMFLHFGEAYNIPNKVIEKTIDQISKTVQKNILEVKNIGFSAKKTKHLITTIEKRIKDLQ